MQTGAKLLTAPTPPFANYEPEKLQSSTISLVSSSLLFWQIERALTQEEVHMDQPQPQAKSRNRDEIWFSISRSARQEPEKIRGQHQSPFQATSSRAHSDRSVSPVPSISTPAGINKPLPPSPEPEKKRRKPLSLRSLVRRRTSIDEPEPDRTHLQPEPYQRQRSSSANATLSPDPHQNYRQHQSTRSVPSSPSYPPNDMARTHAATASYGYSDPSYHHQYSQQSTYRSHRTHSIDSDFEAQPPRARRTFPESPTPSNAPAQRQRPRTWLSPGEGGNEAFHDPSEFHLFVQATSGLPDGGYSTFSPTSPDAHLQGSLYPRGRQNDRIPIPLQHSYSARPSSQQSYDISSWQTTPGYEYNTRQSSRQPLVSSSALPSPARSHHSTHSHHSQRSRASPNIHAVNLELERLGLSEDEDRDDDELPNYQQSQAEMSEKKRREAASRARELEARWNRSRGRS